MRIILLIISLLSIFNISSFGQLAPKEGYITCNNSNGYFLSRRDDFNSNFKGNCFLYFNDSCVLLHLSAFGKKNISLRIYSKSYQKEDKRTIISCFDSSTNARHPNKNDLQDSIPDLVITMSYSSNDLIEIDSLTKLKKPIYTEITCYFYHKDLAINFGSPVKFPNNEIPALKKKYTHFIIEIPIKPLSLQFENHLLPPPIY